MLHAFNWSVCIRTVDRWVKGAKEEEAPNVFCFLILFERFDLADWIVRIRWNQCMWFAINLYGKCVRGIRASALRGSISICSGDRNGNVFICDDIIRWCLFRHKPYCIDSIVLNYLSSQMNIRTNTQLRMMIIIKTIIANVIFTQQRRKRAWDTRNSTASSSHRIPIKLSMNSWAICVSALSSWFWSVWSDVILGDRGNIFGSHS